MEQNNSNNQDNSLRQGIVHLILSHSYTMFLFAIILGATFHMIFHIQIFSGTIYPYIGFIIIVLGSLLIYWAQHTSSCTTREYQLSGSTRNFSRGPYKYSRNPTHIGLTVMTLGLAVVLNSFFTIFFLICAAIITKIIFLKEEEALLEERYGQTYCDYKKKVKSWL